MCGPLAGFLLYLGPLAWRTAVSFFDLVRAPACVSAFSPPRGHVLFRVKLAVGLAYSQLDGASLLQTLDGPAAVRVHPFCSFVLARLPPGAGCATSSMPRVPKPPSVRLGPIATGVQHSTCCLLGGRTSRETPFFFFTLDRILHHPMFHSACACCILPCFFVSHSSLISRFWLIGAAVENGVEVLDFS